MARVGRLVPCSRPDATVSSLIRYGFLEARYQGKRSQLIYSSVKPTQKGWAEVGIETADAAE
jgi:hypothetical protein